MFGQHLVQISSNSEMVELESVRKFVELTQNDPSWSIRAFGHNRYEPRSGEGLLLLWWRAGSPCNTVWPGPWPTSMPSFIMIHPAVWPQYTNVRDRTGQAVTVR